MKYGYYAWNNVITSSNMQLITVILMHLLPIVTQAIDPIDFSEESDIGK